MTYHCEKFNFITAFRTPIQTVWRVYTVVYVYHANNFQFDLSKDGMTYKGELLKIKDKSIIMRFLTRKMISESKPKVLLYFVQGTNLANYGILITSIKFFVSIFWWINDVITWESVLNLTTFLALSNS